MNDDFKFQLSVKIDGQHLLNIRTGKPEEFSELLKYAVENSEQIQAACAALEGVRKPEPARPALTPGHAPVVSQGGVERELGPLVLENVEIKRAGKDGTVWKSPMFILKWDGSSASTFDQLVGKAAQGFWTQGAQCYVTVAPSPKNPKFMNAVSIRMATQ